MREGVSKRVHVEMDENATLPGPFVLSTRIHEAGNATARTELEKGMMATSLLLRQKICLNDA